MTAASDLFAGRYRFDRRLGMGGMATVQLAFDTRLERNVAVKLLAEHLAEDASFTARFRREALAAGRLVHPNIVQVFDFGADGETGRQYIVMEFVDGPSCADILSDHDHLEPPEAVDILAQACRGLDYAHRHGVVHRDVKPGNLLRGRDGSIKLADFGIAKAREQSSITKIGSVLGTAAYLSPEQARGDAAGPASDLYALGVVAYQLLAGRLPYQAASLTDLARQQDSGPPPPLHELAPEVPRSLSVAVRRALHPDPAGRYPSAAAMESALNDGLRGIAPERTAATRPLGDEATQMLTGDPTAATRALPRRQATQQRPARRPSAAPPPPSRRERAAPPPAHRPRGSGLRIVAWLLAILVVVALGIGGYQLATDTGRRAVQLREEVRGNADRAVEEIKGLIEDNTR